VEKTQKNLCSQNVLFFQGILLVQPQKMKDKHYCGCVTQQTQNNPHFWLAKNSAA
jgi:hypothetical protein